MSAAWEVVQENPEYVVRDGDGVEWRWKRNRLEWRTDRAPMWHEEMAAEGYCFKVNGERADMIHHLRQREAARV